MASIERFWPRKRRMISASVFGFLAAVMFVVAGVTYLTPAEAAGARAVLPQASSPESADMINVLGYEIPRDRVAIPTDWGQPLTKPLKVQVAYNNTSIYFRAQFPSPYPGVQHDVLRFENGQWKAYGKSSNGSVPYGLYEDRFTFHVDDGSVRGFALQGCSVSCHQDLRDPFTYAAPTKDEVAQNSYFSDVIKKTDTRKYIPDSRNPGEDWWDVNWTDISAADADRIAALKEAGVFLDQWHWRAARGGPIGQSDDMWVLDYRNGDAGASAYTNNLDSSTGLPTKMFDPETTGIAAMSWTDIENVTRDLDAPYYLAEGTMKDFDPNYPWKEGDVLPNKILRVGEESRGDILSTSSWIDGWWTVELRRALDSGNSDDKQFDPARVYNLGFAFYTAGTGNRFHYVTFVKSLAFNRPADIRAESFAGDTPDWNQVPVSEFTSYYPGQATWQFLTSDEHPGAPAIRSNTRACATCHTEEQVANLAVGLELRSERESGRVLTWIAGLVGIAAIAAAGWTLRRA